MVVGGDVVVPHLQMKVSLVVAGKQAQVSMRDRMTIHSIENADGDGFVVDDREVLIRAAHLSRVDEQRRAQAESKRKGRKLRPEELDSASGSLKSSPIVLNPWHV
jgi:hypothetical protein